MTNYEKIDQENGSMVIVNAERVGDDAPVSFAAADASTNPYDDDETIDDLKS